MIHYEVPVSLGFSGVLSVDAEVLAARSTIHVILLCSDALSLSRVLRVLDIRELCYDAEVTSIHLNIVPQAYGAFQCALTYLSQCDLMPQTLVYQLLSDCSSAVDGLAVLAARHAMIQQARLGPTGAPSPTREKVCRTRTEESDDGIFDDNMPRKRGCSDVTWTGGAYGSSV